MVSSTGRGSAYDFILGNTIERVWELMSKIELISVALTCLLMGLIAKKSCALRVKTFWCTCTLSKDELNLMMAQAGSRQPEVCPLRQGAPFTWIYCIPSDINGLLTNVVLRQMQSSEFNYFFTQKIFTSSLKGSLNAYTTLTIIFFIANRNAALPLLSISLVKIMTKVSGTFPPRCTFIECLLSQFVILALSISILKRASLSILSAQPISKSLYYSSNVPNPLSFPYFQSNDMTDLYNAIINLSPTNFHLQLTSLTHMFVNSSFNATIGGSYCGNYGFTIGSERLLGI